MDVGHPEPCLVGHGTFGRFGNSERTSLYFEAFLSNSSVGVVAYRSYPSLGELKKSSCVLPRLIPYIVQCLEQLVVYYRVIGCPRG